MNWKKALIVVILLATAGYIGKWRLGQYEKSKPGDPLGTRLTFDYQGNVGGLFKELTARSGAHYQVNPAIADRSVRGSFKNYSVVQIQEIAAREARLRYSPPEDGSDMIKVNSR